MATIDLSEKRAFKKTLPRFFQYLVLSIVTLVVVVPARDHGLGALKTRGEMFTHPYTLPNPPHWENFARSCHVPHSGSCCATA